MKSIEINKEAIELVAIGLKDLKDNMVFVGGAIVSLYADYPTGEEIRVTSDIDMTTEIAHFQEWAVLNEQLIARKFNPDPQGHAMIRYTYKDIPVDIIPDGAVIAVGETNRWYAFGYDDVRTVKVNSQEIQIFGPAIFIATKFEAFKNRGRDYRTSHDIEDIIFVLQNNEGIVEDIANTHGEVITFLKEQLHLLITTPSSDEMLAAHIHPEQLAESLPLLKAIINAIIKL
jgi:predicted nucleotidyltransferase